MHNVVFLLFLGSGAIGQCPLLTIELPNRLLNLEVEEPFQARVSGKVDEKLRYTWASTVGTILNPYSGPEIRLVVPRKSNGTNATVFVRVEGLPDGCSNLASEIIGVASLPIGEPVDNFERLNKGDLMARVDNYIIFMVNSDSKAKGLIDLYFGLNESRSQRITRIRNILEAFRFRKFDIRRVEFAFIETKTGPGNTLFWIIPTGANRKWIIEDRPGAIFVDGPQVMRNPQTALPKRVCDCTWN